MDLPTSTLTGLEPMGRERLARWGRRAFLALLLVFVLAGLLGALGDRTRTTTGSRDGYTLSVEHASVARAGLDVPWRVTVRHPGGFGDSLTLAVTADYFDIFETQGFHPEPSASRRDADTLYLTFDAPAGDTFVVAYDAYIQPASQRGQDATITLIDGDHTPVVSVDINTFLLP